MPPPPAPQNFGSTIVATQFLNPEAAAAAGEGGGGGGGGDSERQLFERCGAGRRRTPDPMF